MSAAPPNADTGPVRRQTGRGGVSPPRPGRRDDRGGTALRPRHRDSRGIAPRQPGPHNDQSDATPQRPGRRNDSSATPRRPGPRDDRGGAALARSGRESSCGTVLRRPGRRNERGIVTLEWLLLLSAVAALAGSALMILQRVLDDTAEVPPDPLVRIAQIETAAAIVADEAQKLYDDDPTAYDTQHDAHMKDRCEDVFDKGVDSGIVELAHWASPGGTSNRAPARCTVTPGNLVTAR